MTPEQEATEAVELAGDCLLERQRAMLALQLLRLAIAQTVPAATREAINARFAELLNETAARLDTVET